MKRWGTFLPAAVLVVCLPAAAQAVTFNYSITLLDTDIAYSSLAQSINNKGQVVGWYSPAPDAATNRACIWENGTMVDLGVLPGGNYSIANDINEVGQIVGSSYGGDRLNHAVIWDTSGIHDLGTFGKTGSAAYGVNNAGKIIGGSWSVGPPYSSSGFVIADGSFSELASTLPGSYSAASGINDIGQVVGLMLTIRPTGLEQVAARWDGGSVVTLQNPFGGTQSFANAINNHGQVVGGAMTADNLTWRATFWANGEATVLGASDANWSNARDVNELGEVVGFQYTSGNGPQRAYIWADGVATDLNSLIDPTSGWNLWEATSINDSGQIVGHGLYNGITHAFLLDKNDKNTLDDGASNPVPEPGAFVLLGSGLAALACARRRRIAEPRR